ncbi:sorting nexin-24 isoform X1 [Hemibagrus wyckioides]|uniref:sorting nexin-24 isoform X1 n=1 Tax=Hemibagrus wyckioides TaxID=337641 RepID=UPI00266B5AAE|nr:sorting nexin-24 isoform X1 [Hemibagrus wyckioides]
MHPVSVSIPSFRSEDSASEKGYTVFKIEVLTSGRQHTVEKRYSEFHALHKMLKKIMKPPELPSKHVRNWIPKVLEQRRHGLELYLQTIIMENEVLPKIFLDFLNIRHFPSLPKAESCGSFETESEDSCKLTHQPALLFLRDPYLLPATNGTKTHHLEYYLRRPSALSSIQNSDTFSNVITEGVIHGIFYPDLQPR